MKVLILSLFFIIDSSKISMKNQIKQYIATSETIVFKEVFYAITLLETGRYQSKNFCQHNNIAGIKYNRRGYCVGKTKKGYAIYDNWQCSIDDYAYIERKILKKYPAKTNKEFIRSLIRYGYARDQNYTKKITNILRKNRL